MKVLTPRYGSTVEINATSQELIPDVRRVDWGQIVHVDVYWPEPVNGAMTKRYTGAEIANGLHFIPSMMQTDMRALLRTLQTAERTRSTVSDAAAAAAAAAKDAFAVPCTDVPPDSQSTCDQLASWGLCDSDELRRPAMLGDGSVDPAGYCARTCGRCPGAAGAPAAVQAQRTPVRPVPTMTLRSVRCSWGSMVVEVDGAPPGDLVMLAWSQGTKGPPNQVQAYNTGTTPQSRQSMVMGRCRNTELELTGSFMAFTVPCLLGEGGCGLPPWRGPRSIVTRANGQGVARFSRGGMTRRACRQFAYQAIALGTCEVSELLDTRS